LSFRDVEELLAERGVVVSYQTIRQWCQKFGPHYARKLRHKKGQVGDIRHLDELFVTIQGKRHYLRRAVDQDGDVIDILVQKHRNAHAAKRFFRKLLKGQEAAPWRLVTDKLRSYSAAHREVMSSVTHDTRQYENNRAEVSHQPTRSENVRCGGSSHLARLSCFSQFAVWSRTSLGWDGITYEQKATGGCGIVPFGNGRM
jgi:putative transposase